MVSNTIKLGLAIALVVLGGCQDPISSMMTKKNESDWKDINSVSLIEPVTIDTKPSNGTNVRVSNKMFVEIDKAERIFAPSKLVAINFINHDGFDSSLVTNQIEKNLIKNGFSVTSNASPIIIKINAISEKYAKTQGNVNALSGIGSLASGLGASAALSASSEVLGAIAGGRQGESGIARGVSYTVTFMVQSRTIKLDHIEGIDTNLNNPEIIRTRDINLFTAMIAKSVSEIITSK